MEKYQPVLPQSNASPFIAPGVSDTSMATLVSGLGKLGVAAYTGYAEAGLEKDIEGVTQDYFNNQKQYEEGLSAGEEASGVGKGLDSYWDNVSAEQGTVEDVSFLESKFKQKMETYTSAMKQGKMTADQLYSRIIATTKEHVSRNPWLQRELLKTADDYLEITGLGGYIKTAQKSAKEEADFQKKFIQERITRADKLGLQPFNNPNWNADLQEREAGVAKLEEMSKGLAYVKEMLPEQASAFLTKARPVVFPAIWTNLQNSMITQMNAKQPNGQPIPWEQQKFNVRRDALQFKDDLVSAVTKNNPRLLTDPNVAEFMKHVGTTVEELNKAMDSFGSGEDAMKFAQNQYNAVHAKQQLQISGQVNMPAVEAFSSLMKGLPPGTQERMMANNPNALTQVLATGASLLSGMVTPGNVTQGGAALDVILGAGQQGQSTSSPLGQAVNTMIKTINDPAVVKDPITKVNTISSIVTRMADVNNKDQFAAMSPTDRAAATTVTAEYIDAAKALVDKNIQKLAEEGVILNFSQQADGSVILTYAEGSKRNDDELKRLNSIYPGHINNAIKAYAHLAGRTDYNQVLKDFFLGNDSPGNVPQATPDKVPKANPSEKAMSAKLSDLYPESPRLANIVELEKEIDKASSPAIKAILINEYENIKKTLQSAPTMNPGAKGKIVPSKTRLPKGVPVTMENK